MFGNIICSSTEEGKISLWIKKNEKKNEKGSFALFKEFSLGHVSRCDKAFKINMQNINYFFVTEKFKNE